LVVLDYQVELNLIAVQRDCECTIKQLVLQVEVVALSDFESNSVL